MNAVETPQPSIGKRLLFCALNVLIPGLGFMLKRNRRAGTLNLLGFIVFLFLSAVLAGHERQGAVPFIWAFGMLASGLACWDEPL